MSFRSGTRRTITHETSAPTQAHRWIRWHANRRAGIFSCSSDRRHGQVLASPCHPSNQVRRRTSTVRRQLVWPVLALAFVCGCAGSKSVFEIVDYRPGTPPSRYQEVFSEAYYQFDGSGNVDVVLLRTQPSEDWPDLDITQIIHLESVWRPIPGETVAERTQINGMVTYCIISGNLGATFEGAGSIFFSHNARKDRLEGSLDLAMLRPTRQLTSTSDYFTKAELSGRFIARRDGRRVTRIVNDIERRFGPRRRK